MIAAYNPDYQPPFPALQIVLREESARSGPFPALLDSGADGTFVPTDLLEEIGAQESKSVIVRSYFGERRKANLYIVGIQIEEIYLPGVYVVGDDTATEIILGRDVLNKLSLFLDGPVKQTDLLDNATVNRLRSRRRR